MAVDVVFMYWTAYPEELNFFFLNVYFSHIHVHSKRYVINLILILINVLFPFFYTLLLTILSISFYGFGCISAIAMSLCFHSYILLKCHSMSTY